MLTKNQRGIVLLHTDFKILTMLIMERLNPYVSEIVEEYYYSRFRKGKLTIDQVGTYNLSNSKETL